MADLKISALNSLAGADLVAADVVAVVDDSASETKKLTVSDLIANGVTLISNSTIPSAKILFAAGSVATASVADAGITTAKVADSAVTAAKLADNSSVTLVSTLPASGDFTGQIALDTDDDKIYIWDGSAWDSVKGAGSINVFSGSTSGIVNITTSTSGDTVTVSTTLDDTTAAAQFLGGPTGAGGTVGYRALVGTDLPTATTTAKGGIIVNGEGLRMDSDTIEIDNDITANSSTFQAVKFDSKGLITSGRDITSADLPNATSGATGAVKPGTGLEMGTAGAIDHSNSVAAATNTKITYDAQGHVTAGTTLAASDIPDLDTAKVTTGTFATARIADDAITADKLADRSTATIAETTPSGGNYIGQLHLNSISSDLFLWDGNVWQPIGISVGEIVLAGTYDASTNLMATVTSEGTALSFEVGSALPAASDSNKGYYVVVSEAGTGTSPAPTVSLNPPDFLLSTGTAYTEIDVSSTVTAQQASNVAFTAAGNIAATNVQAAIEELDTEKVGSASPTFTGTVALGEDAVMTFEGATSNAFETTLTVTDPTADRTITLPNVTGTVVTTGDTGSVTSAMIADGAIVNADINASAEIAVSKLANGTARQLLQTDSGGTGVEFTSNVDVPGTFDCTGAGTFDSTLTVTGLISADGKVSFPASTASAPSFYFGTDTNTGLYQSAADEVAITTGGTQRVVVNSSGNVGIGESTPLGKLHVKTADSGIASIGSSADDLVIESDTNAGLTLVSNTENAINFADSGDVNVGQIAYNHSSNYMLFRVNDSERFRIDSSGRLLLGTSTARATGGSQNRYLQVEGTSYATAGLSLTCNSTSNAATFNFGRSRGTSVGSSTVVQDGDDLGFITWSAADGTDLVSYAAQIHAEIDGTPGSNDTPGALVFSTTADGNAGVSERLRVTSSGNVSLASSATILYSDGDVLFTGDAGNFNWDKSDSSLKLQDNAKAKFGTGGDLEIFHDGSHSWIKDVGTGALQLSGGRITMRKGDASSEYMFTADADGAVELYYDNSKKFETKSTGVGVTGQLDVGTTSILSTGDISMGDSDKLRCGNGDDLQIYHDGTNSVIDSNTGDLLIRNVGTTGDIYLDAKTGERGIKIIQDGAVILYHNGSEKFTTTSTGVEITGGISGVVTVKNSSVGEIDALTSASTITPDFAASNNFSVTLGTNATLANPSNLTAGQSGVIAITQDGTGSRTMAFGNKFKFAGGTAPTLTTTASAVDILTYYVESTSRITAQVLLNVS